MGDIFGGAGGARLSVLVLFADLVFAVFHGIRSQGSQSVEAVFSGLHDDDVAGGVPVRLLFLRQGTRQRGGRSARSSRAKFGRARGLFLLVGSLHGRMIWEAVKVYGAR